MKPFRNACDILLVCIVAMLLMHALSPGTVEVPLPAPAGIGTEGNGTGNAEEPPMDFPFA